jgi:heptosyltransferase III
MRIIIIRPGAIGDTLVTIPILQQLRSHFQQVHITFVGNATVLPLLRSMQLVDRAENYEHPQWSRLFLPPERQQHDSFLTLLQQTDIAICWLRDPDGTVAKNLQAAGIKQVLMAPGRPGADEPLHIVHYLTQTIAQTIDPLSSLSTETLQWQTPTEFQWSKEGASRPYAIHPGSGGTTKCWPVPCFATIIRELWQHDIPVLLLAGPAESIRIKELTALLPAPPRPNLFRILLDQPLLTIARELQRCRGYLGNDSGITHLSALLGVPTTVLFGPSDPTIWKPIGPRVTVIHEPDLQHLSPDHVFTHLLPSDQSENQ